MAEIHKLSAGEALDKLRRTEAPRAKMTRLDEEIGALDQETQRLRMARRGLERGQRAAAQPGVKKADARRATKLIVAVTMIGIVVVTLVLAWSKGLF